MLENDGDSAGDQTILLGCLGVLFFIYTVMVMVLSPDQLRHDEPRYFQGARNLVNGHFVKKEDPDFNNGPGYPLLLTPAMACLDFDSAELVRDSEDYEFYLAKADGSYEPTLKWRLLPLRLLNPFFLVAGWFVIYRASRLLVSARTALLVVIALALNPFQLRFVAYLMTENVTPLLCGGFAWLYLRNLQSESFRWRYAILAGLVFAMLALTRTLFGYVALAALVTAPLYCLIERRSKLALRTAVPFASALLFCAPYLSYTHHHAGKFFCWATNGSELLYWITSPKPGEYGSWQQLKWVEKDPVLSKNHLRFLKSIDGLPVAEREAAWKEAVKKHLASENIVPALIRNYVANLCRMFFNSPRTRTDQTMAKLLWVLTGAGIAAALGSAVIPSLFRWRKFPFALKQLILIAGITLCGIFLLPAEPRYLVPIFPLLFIWIGYVWEKLIQVEIRLKD